MISCDINTSAPCDLPAVLNGKFGGDCSDVQVISKDTECSLVCDLNYMESVPAVRCIDAGTLSHASPTCTGIEEYIALNEVVKALKAL